jgi:hypothetical protein
LWLGTAFPKNTELLAREGGQCPQVMASLIDSDPIEEDRDIRYQHASEIEWSTRQSSSTAIGTAWPVTIWSSIPPRCRIRQRLSFFQNFPISHNSDDVAIRHPSLTPGCFEFSKFRSRGYCGFRLIRSWHRREGHSRRQDLANFAGSEPAAWRSDWLHPDLPEDQSAHYLLVAVFFRGSTNPPPDNWFT